MSRNIELVSGPEAAKILGIRPQTLRIWRMTGRGPKYIRYGGRTGRIVYRVSDLEAWLDAQTHQNTSEETVKAQGVEHG